MAAGYGPLRICFGDILANDHFFYKTRLSAVRPGQEDILIQNLLYIP